MTGRVEFRLLDEALLRAFVARRTDDAAAILDAELEPDWPDAHDARFLQMWLDDFEQNGTGPWGPRAVILVAPWRRMIGHAGFHGPPGVNALDLAGTVELGYTVFPDFRRQGFATEVALDLMEWARSSHGVRDFVASAAPTNAASLAVLRKLGFTFVTEQIDDVDGLEQVFILRT